MQAVIMAAGSSTRTYPLTLTRPKPLVPIWGQPLLELQLRQLRGLVDEVVLVVGFLKEQVQERFGRDFDGIELSYAVQKQQRGTADALLAARPHLSSRSSRTLVLNGDDFYHHADLQRLSRTGRGLLVTRAKDPQNRAVVSIEEGDDADRRILSIVEKPSSPPPDAWCSVGGYCIERDDLTLLDELPLSPRGELELPDFISRLIEATTVRPSPIERFWMPLTFAWDVLGLVLFLWEEPARARELGLTSEPAGRLPRSVTIDGPVWLGANVTIEDGVRLVGPTAIGPGSVIERDALVERCVFFENVRLGREAHVSHSILGSGVSIGGAARLSSAPGSALRVDVKGKPVAPEIERLGAIAGDGAVIASRAAIAAGSLLAPRTTSSA